ncbi:MAG: NADH-quinone oxidoreductase subunit A [Hydrogenibacillus sp.]|nr:NADH-quinone oxidoreductase subunit A [Hydrogenibacillus sp.]
MPSLYWYNYLVVVLFIALGIGLPIVAFALSRLLRPKHAYAEKTTTYESGAEPIGTSWVRFKVKYYLYALLFLVFDVETLFLYPWAVAFDRVGTFALLEMVIFLAILAFGLFYAWRKDVLEWK